MRAISLYFLNDLKAKGGSLNHLKSDADVGGTKERMRHVPPSPLTQRHSSVPTLVPRFGSEHSSLRVTNRAPVKGEDALGG